MPRLIPTREVTDAYLALLQGAHQIGDGAAPDTIDRSRPWGWITAPGRPGEPPQMGGGEPTATLRYRVTCTAVDGDGEEVRAARRQAEWLDDATKAVMLTDPAPTGERWRVTGRWREATAFLPGDGAHTIHADYRIFVALTTG